MLKKILIALLALVVVFLVVVALRPSEFHVERTATMAAAPAAVFDQVNDFHKWEAWSPWAKLDPNAKITFEGPPSGTGTIMNWAGNNEVGEGKMTLTESKPNELVKINVDIVKPMEGTSSTEFTFRPDGDKHAVTEYDWPSQLPCQGHVPGDERQEDDVGHHGQGPRQHKVCGGGREQYLSLRQ